jgi:hypothetical protein
VGTRSTNLKFLVFCVQESDLGKVLPTIFRSETFKMKAKQEVTKTEMKKTSNSTPENLTNLVLIGNQKKYKAVKKSFGNKIQGQHWLKVWRPEQFSSRLKV